MENNIVVTQDMIDTFTTEMQEAYQKYGDDEEIVHSMMDCIKWIQREDTTQHG